jgi:hypothetical protein
MKTLKNKILNILSANMTILSIVIAISIAIITFPLICLIVLSIIPITFILGLIAFIKEMFFGK